MCGKCASNWGYCGCDGGSVFGVCPASKGQWCGVCEHYPGGFTKETYAGIYLEEFVDADLIKKARTAYVATLPKEQQ